MRIKKIILEGNLVRKTEIKDYITFLRDKLVDL